MESASLASQALHALPTAVLVVDEQRKITLANRRACEILDRKRDELEKQSLDTFFVGMAKDKNLRLSEEQRLSASIKLSDASLFSIGYSCKPFTDTTGSSSRNYWTIVFQDTSKLLELERERDRLLRIATIGQALPSLLHELKNPLAAIAATAEVLLDDPLDDDVAEQLHAILSEVRRMKLSFDGIGALERPLRSDQNQAVDFACREAGAVLKHRARNAKVHLQLEIDVMPLLPFDSGVMRALVLNFVTNSIQACTQGDAITLSLQHIRKGNTMEMRVVDTGKGIPTESLARVTELFYSTKTSGSGIGLALCTRVIEDAGGRMQIESVPGFGTSVSVSVPCDEQARQQVTHILHTRPFSHPSSSPKGI